ncbi:hypothetical protein BJ973_009647 [Actinoplanes tereljensis]
MHWPKRPTWDCMACQSPWPCYTAKVQLTAEFTGERTRLRVYLAAQMWEAIDDCAVPGDGRPRPNGLYERFLFWTQQDPSQW